MGHWVNINHDKTGFKKGNEWAWINRFPKGNRLGQQFKKGVEYPWLYQKGEKHPRWNGGRIISIQGYVMIYSPNHPYRNKTGYVQEHRLVVEQHLGRYLKREELVHHINGNKQDNRIENLQKVSQAEHNAIHFSKVEAPFIGT
jgi:hypothetical protein